MGKQPTRWDDKFYVTCYELARSGQSNRAIARTIGVTSKTFLTWRRVDSALQDALNRGRTTTNNKNGVQTFFEYVFQRLPPRLQKYWKLLGRYETEKNSIQRIEALFQRHGETVRKHLFIHAAVASNFSLSAAMSKVNINRRTFETWVTTDPDFSSLIDELVWHKKNFFEAALVSLVARGDSPATIFVNKTMNRDRGYAEKQEVSVEHSGTVEHQHKHLVVSVDSLDLPLETRLAILEAIRAQKTIQPLALEDKRGSED